MFGRAAIRQGKCQRGEACHELHRLDADGDDAAKRLQTLLVSARAQEALCGYEERAWAVRLYGG